MICGEPACCAGTQEPYCQQTAGIPLLLAPQPRRVTATWETNGPASHYDDEAPTRGGCPHSD